MTLDPQQRSRRAKQSSPRSIALRPVLLGVLTWCSAVVLVAALAWVAINSAGRQAGRTERVTLSVENAVGGDRDDLPQGLPGPGGARGPMPGGVPDVDSSGSPTSSRSGEASQDSPATVAAARTATDVDESPGSGVAGGGAGDGKAPAGGQNGSAPDAAGAREASSEQPNVPVHGVPGIPVGPDGSGAAAGSAGSGGAGSGQSGATASGANPGGARPAGGWRPGGPGAGGSAAGGSAAGGSAASAGPAPSAGPAGSSAGPAPSVHAPGPATTASGQPSPQPSAPSGPAASASPSAAAAGAQSSPSTSDAPAVRGSQGTPGGVVTAECRAGQVTSWTAVPDTGWSVIGGSSQGAVLRTGFQHGSAVVDVHVGCGSSGAPTFEVEGPAARGLGTG